MKIMTLTAAALAVSVAAIVPASAGSRGYMDEPDYQVMQHRYQGGIYDHAAGGYADGGQVYEGPAYEGRVYEGRQAVEIYPGISGADATRLKIMQDKDANSNR